MVVVFGCAVINVTPLKGKTIEYVLNTILLMLLIRRYLFIDTVMREETD